MIVPAGTIRKIMPTECDFPAVIVEICRLNPSIFDEPPFHIPFFHQEGKTIVLPKIPVEIDIVFKQRRQTVGQVIPLSERSQGIEEGIGDPASDDMKS